MVVSYHVRAGTEPGFCARAAMSSQPLSHLSSPIAPDIPEGILTGNKNRSQAHLGFPHPNTCNRPSYKEKESCGEARVEGACCTLAPAPQHPQKLWHASV